MTPNQPQVLSDEKKDSIFADWLDAACLIHQEGSDTIEPAPQTHLHKNDVVQLMRVVESATLAALAQQAPRGSYKVIGSRTVITHQTPAQQAQEPVARLHITETDTYPDIEVEVLNGTTLQPGMSPVNIYTTPQPKPAPPVPEKCLTCSGHGLIGGHLPDGSGHGEPCPDCNAPPVPAPVDEREAFEQWASKEPWFLPHMTRRIKGSDQYDDPDMFASWKSWQARAALQSPAPQATKGQP